MDGIKMKKTIEALKKELKQELKEAKNKRKTFIQLYVDTIEKDKLDAIEIEYNKQCKVIKALNKRITLLKGVLRE